MKLSPGARKGIGISVVSLFACIELLFLGTLIYPLFDGTATMPQSMSLLFVMGIMAFPLWWGLRVWKSGNAKTSPALGNDLPDTGSEPITIKTNVTFDDYRRVVFLQTYTHPIFLFIHLIGITFIAFYLFQGDWNWFVFFIIFFLLYLPIAVYRSAKKVYNSTKMLHGSISYTFTSESIITAGEISNSTMQWQSLHKVKETKQWFLLYCNTQAVMIIPKLAFSSEQEMERFRRVAGMVG